MTDLAFDARGRQDSGWTNKLIWGDNKLILSSLKNDPQVLTRELAIVSTQVGTAPEATQPRN